MTSTIILRKWIASYLIDNYFRRKNLFWTLANWHISVDELTLDISETTSCVGELTRRRSTLHDGFLKYSWYQEYTVVDAGFFIRLGPEIGLAYSASYHHVSSIHPSIHNLVINWQVNRKLNKKYNKKRKIVILRQSTKP